MTVIENYERELSLEAEADTIGIQNYMKKREKEDESSLPPGQRLLREALVPTIEGIEEFLAEALDGKAGKRHTAAPYMEICDVPSMAYCAVRVALNEAAVTATAQSAIRGIGQAVRDDYEFKALSESNPGLYHVVQRDLERSTSARHRQAVMRHAVSRAERSVEGLTWSNAEIIRVGEKLLDIVIEKTGLVELTRETRGRNNTPRVIRPTEACATWLEKAHARCALLAPMHLPMVVEPRLWTAPECGGYLRQKLTLVKTRNRDYLEGLGSVHMPDVYNAVNAVQGTPWRINRFILRVMKEAWDSGMTVGKLPDRQDAPLPAKPFDFDKMDKEALKDNQQFKEWKAQAGRVHQQNGAARSKRLQAAMKLWLAEKFADEDVIYFPHQLDFRGRIYPVVALVNPQADDTGKALLEFGRGRPLGEGGAYWLAVHIAGLFGVDKVPFDERVQWVLDHEAEIVDSAVDPLDGERFWTTADKPWCALAACSEWLGYTVHGDDHVCHMPVALDGSCSGLQHFSALLRDPRGANAVNLLPADRPQDIYTEVARVTQELVDADREPEAGPWKNGKVIRAIVKQPTMTVPYGATVRGMQGQIVSALKKLDEAGVSHLGGADNFKAARYLAPVVYDAIGEVVFAARTAMDWLQEVARIAADDETPITWTAPSGFPVLQEYRVEHGKRLKTHFGGQRVMLTFTETGTKLNKRRQASGISPNFVHSLDASHLVRAVLTCEENGIHDFALVHDSYGTHPADVEKLSLILRLTLAEMYREPIIERFMKQVAENLSEEQAEKLPAPPPVGDLELESLEEAQYSFA